ncbi:putative Ribosomal RNA small subunit methyltransferase E [uncultured Desulfobacterium sp.]|uniref:Ribosomal RNA small subunit methyltransferase E n=1 Tax=uncultured Desulfobacterium sp. TaxID=201089 RepID=A0A445MWZ3_9BACT|nr:putative Ribosomal RNA small subunit methyltransferase E [uncultured Desulfobacterium sp.]
MRNFLVEEISAINGVCLIRGSEAWHISRVLRMKQGDHIVLMDKKGGRFESSIESISSREVKVRLKRPLEKQASTDLSITLCQAVTKSNAMDLIIQKASELGVESLTPFFSERSVVRLDQDRITNKMMHWKGVAESSAKQCGRAVTMQVESPLELSSLLEKWREKDALKVILWEKEAENDLKSLLKSTCSIKDFVGIIGPEGGFTEGEVLAGRGAGFIPVSLGVRILRAETAALAIAVIVQYELGDLGLSSAST